YRHQFLEKYGPGAEVPVLELLSPECGLGVPPSFFRPPRFFYTNASAKRERVLHELAQDALNCHALEVELNEAQIAALQTWNPRVEQAPHSLEIYLQVQAASREALDRGHWCTVVSPNPGSPNGGRSFGRFFDLLGEAGLHALRDLLAREEALEPESIFAELNYQPWHARSANVAIRPGLHTHEIAVGTTPTRSPEHVILLRDLVVGIHNDRFYLRSLSRNKKVIVRQLHMLNIAQAPPVCRFLSDIASDGMPVLASFDWGSLSIAPFLPRLTIRQAPHASLVLSPARWTLEATTLQRQGQGNGEARRFSLRDFRTRWRVPRYVYLTEADNRLLLDLEHPLMVAELFQALDTLKEGQQVVLQEVLPDLEHLWLRDTDGAPYFSEIVVPLLRRDALESSIPLEVSPQAKTFPPVPHHVSSQVRVCYPGDAWNYIKLYCTPEQQEAIIARPLRELIAQLREQQRIDRWFFVRYADPQPHLRVRIHAGTSEQVQPALHFLLSWSRQLATQGLIQRSVLDTYEREVARYGGPAAIDLLEEVFSIDSDICTNLVAAQYAHHLALDPLAVAVVSLDRFFSAWNYDTDRRLQWLQKRTEKYAFSKEFHRKRRYYSELLASWEQADPELASQRSTLYEFTPFENHLSSLAPQVRALDRAGNLWGTEEDLLASLAHMHNVRLLGLDTSKEQHVYAFWRHALVSISAQQKRG
ncbi:MAG: lantibiotic dehydratase, partial [Ktedonobacteraceae bacterium]|nr:lantibiotic dehydratase [Ktedonobacteraceae bacterium]